MSSIPLPALDIRPPQQQESPIEQYGKVMQLKSLMGQQQLQQQELQKGQLDIQNRQAGMKAMQQWDGKSYNDLPDLLRKNGADLPTVMEAQQKVLEQQQKYSAIAKDDAETGKNNLETLKGKNDLAVGALNTLDKVPDEQLAQSLTQAAQTLAQQGTIDPQHAQMAMQLAQQGDPQKIRQGLESFKKSLTGNAAQMTQAETEAKTVLAKAQLPGAQAESQIKGAEAQAIQQYGGLNQNMADSKYRFLQQQKDLGKPVGAEDKAFMQAYEKQKTLVPAFNINAQMGGMGGAGGQGSIYDKLNPMERNIVDKIGSGGVDLPTALMPYRRFPGMAEKIQGALYERYPDYSQANYGVAKKVQESATSGKIGEELAAFNTALTHADLLKQAADAMQNGDVRALNSIGNKLGVQFGSDKATNFNVIKNAYTREVTKALSAGHLTDAEISQQGGTIPDNASPAQISGAVSAYKALMASKIQIRKQQIEQGMQGKANYGGQQHAPGAQANLPEGQTGKGSDGKTYVVKGGVWVPKQ